jgi:hypothetical protein
MLLVIVVVLFALLLSGLLVAFIFRRDFRDAVLGGHGEATFLGLLSVKGVAIVLLCGLFIGAILFAIRLSPSPTGLKADTASGPIDMRLYVSFSPEVNARNIVPKAFIKTSDGPPKPIPVQSKVDEGGVSIWVKVPDMETPFFIVFPTEKGTWTTDDYSVKEARAVAHKQGQE